jgi:hypothetical protein
MRKPVWGQCSEPQLMQHTKQQQSLLMTLSPLLVSTSLEYYQAMSRGINAHAPRYKRG